MVRRGPRTSEGKAASGRNAVTHGLTAEAPVVRQVESVEDWEYHLEQVIASLEPEGYVETQLAVRVAELLWCQRRIPQYEADKISLSLDQMPDDYSAVSRYGAAVTGRPIKESFMLDKIKMQTGIRMLPDGDPLRKITRYESHLHRQLIQTLQLEARQARRKGEPTPLARLDISGPPGS